jgi:hypothetical protein
VLLSGITLLFFYYLRQSWPDDTETRRFTAIAMGGTVVLSLIALITIVVLSCRRKGGERSTPD